MNTRLYSFTFNVHCIEIGIQFTATGGKDELDGLKSSKAIRATTDGVVYEYSFRDRE